MKCPTCGHDPMAGFFVRTLDVPMVSAGVLINAGGGDATPALGGCTCYNKPPTPPTCRDPNEHLPNCPAVGSGYPVGAFMVAFNASAAAPPPKPPWNGV